MDFTYLLSDLYTQVLVAVLAVSLILLCLYYGLVYLRVGRYRRTAVAKEPSEGLPPVSVVLTAQNDGEWLRANLLYLLEQDYPDFEVVVVDYLSHDDTKFVLQVLSENYKHLKVVTFRDDVNGFQGKKYPLSIGIRSAKNDILLLADPDCMPKDQERFCWIREMVAGYVHRHIDIVLGYCGIRPKASLFNWLQQYDNLDYSTEYLAAASLHRPFTGNGRNLSYLRSLFLNNNGFIYHYHEPDGADDMFVNQNCRKHNTALVLTPSSFTMAAPQPTLHDWRELRLHRTRTHRYYKFGLKLQRMIRPLNVFLFYLTGALLLAAGTFPWELLAALLAVKLAWQMVCMAQSTRRLDVRPAVYILSPLFEIYFLLANTILSFSPLHRKK